MTSRERVRAALDHRQPDRVPVDLGGSIVTGINAMGYARLKRLLGLPGPARVTSVTLLLAEVEQELAARWGLDVLPVPRYYAAPGVPLDGRWREHPLPDGAPALFPRGFAPRLRSDGAWELLEEGQVAVGGDRQELGHSLHETEQERVERGHSRSHSRPTSPRTIASLIPDLVPPNSSRTRRAAIAATPTTTRTATDP